MSFNDMSCPKCKKRMGWVGPIPDKIVCIRCEYVIDMTATKREMDEARKELLAEKKKRKEKYEVPDQDT